MKIEVIKGTGIAVNSGGAVLVKDAQSALEMCIRDRSSIASNTSNAVIILVKLAG